VKKLGDGGGSGLSFIKTVSICQSAYVGPRSKTNRIEPARNLDDWIKIRKTASARKGPPGAGRTFKTFLQEKRKEKKKISREKRPHWEG